MQTKGYRVRIFVRQVQCSVHHRKGASKDSVSMQTLIPTSRLYTHQHAVIHGSLITTGYLPTTSKSCPILGKLLSVKQQQSSLHWWQVQSVLKEALRSVRPQEPRSVNAQDRISLTHRSDRLPSSDVDNLNCNYILRNLYDVFHDFAFISVMCLCPSVSLVTRPRTHR